MSFSHDSILKELHPKAKHLMKDFIKEVEERTGYKVYITSGYRSFAKQEELKAQGHTNTSAGNSYHNYGLGLDVNLVKDDVWVKKGSSYNTWANTGVIQIANEYGLRWGGDFSNYDPVHFDLGNYFTISQLKQHALEQFGSDAIKVKGNKVNLNDLV